MDQGPPATAETAESYDAFISYVEEDGRLVADLVKAVEAQQFSAWYYQRNGPKGQPFLREVPAAIRTSRGFVLVVTPNTFGSPNVGAEVTKAHNSHKPILPVLLGVTFAEFEERQEDWAFVVGANPPIEAGPGDDTLAVANQVAEWLRSLPTGPVPPVRVDPPPPPPPPRLSWWLVLRLVALLLAVLSGSIALVNNLREWTARRAVVVPTPVTQPFGQKDAAAMVAAMYLGQVLAKECVVDRHTSFLIACQVDRVGLTGARRQQVLTALQQCDADRTATIEARGKHLTAAMERFVAGLDEAGVAHGGSAADLGLPLGTALTSLNGAADETAADRQLRVKMIVGPSLATAVAVGNRLPLPSKLHGALTSAGRADLATSAGARQALTDLAVFCFWLWRYAEDGAPLPTAIDPADDRAKASGMLTRLGREGFVSG